MYRFFLTIMIINIVLINAEFHKIPLYKTSTRKSLTEIRADMRKFRLDRDADVPSNVVSLYSIDHTHFYSNISIGNPPQTFKVAFDTASADFWVPSVYSDVSNMACFLHNKYNSSKSDSYIKDGKPFTIEYEDGGLSGYLSIDDVRLGSFIVTRQTFGEALNESGDLFISGEFDGIVGMGYPSLSVSNATPLFNSLFIQGQISRPVFGFYLNRNHSVAIGGELALGGSNSDHYDGNLTYVNVSRQEYWQFFIDKVQIQENILCVNGCQAYASTGAATITGPESDIAVINRLIGTTINNIVDCDQIPNLPVINFDLSNKTFELTGEDYILKLEGGCNGTICVSIFTGIVVDEIDGPLWTLGVPFLSRYYSEFDMENNRVGFAPAK